MSARPPLRFSEEDAVVLDRWIDDVCGEEMQFPAHRRAQFAAYRQHLGKIRAVGGQSLFRHTARSGTREILALQNVTSALKRLRACDVGETETVRKEIQAVERLLREKPVAVEGEMMMMMEGGPPPPSSHGASGGDAVPAAESEQDAYESRRKLAARYVAEIDRQRESNRKHAAACHARHSALLDQRRRLSEEASTLRDAEDVASSQLNETSAALASTRDALAREQAAWRELQQSDMYAEAQDAGTGNDEKDEEKEGGHVDALAASRSSLSGASIRLAQTQTELCYQDGSHAVRFRQARQRLKDWQDMADHIRRIHDQLYARTRVIRMVVEANAVALEAESGLGHVERLQKLNHLILERSAKILGLRPESDEEETRPAGGATGRGRDVLRSLFTAGRQSVASSVSVTDAASSLSTPHRHSSVSPTTPTSALVETSFPPPAGGAGSPHPRRQSSEKERRHRQAYALLTDLQRWERALLKESAVLHEICEKGISSVFAPTPSGSPNAVLQELRSLLLEA